MKTIRIVCGERDWKDKETIWSVLDEELAAHEAAWYAACDATAAMQLAHGITLPQIARADRGAMLADFILRHGIAEGADGISNAWALERGVTVERFRAEWRDASGYHAEAGPIRNRKMAKAEPRAQQCLAFWSGKMRTKAGKHEYSGTLDMIKAALGEGILVRVTPPRKDPP